MQQHYMNRSVTIKQVMISLQFVDYILEIDSPVLRACEGSGGYYG
jgi:hypothetical protein